MPQPEHEALAAARAREGTAEGKRLYAQRNGVEGTLSPSPWPSTSTASRPGSPGVRSRQPYLALRRTHCLAGDFANSVRTFPQRWAFYPRTIRA